MDPAETESLKCAVEGLHSCKATYHEQLHVLETFQGKTVWDGEVHIFSLEGHPSASICYAWSAPVPGSDRRRFYAVLQAGPVKSAQDAVRASIIKGYRQEQQKNN